MNILVRKLRDDATLPAYQTAGSAAADIYACLDDDIEVLPQQRVVIPTGLALAVPDGYEAQVRARSGLSLSHGLSLANGVGTIDADYRGELGVIMINHGSEPVRVSSGMRIAQMVVAPAPQVTWQLVDELDKTERGEGGYGSTGH